MLRVHFCVSCGDPLPPKRRVDRRYCLPSCRSVASRARKREKEAAGKVAACAVPEAASSVRQQAVSYGSIPREVLDILARHFGQRDEVVSAELRTAQRRIAELQSALECTEAQQRGTEASNVPLAEAQERIRKLTEAWQSERTEAADRYDKLATKYETLLRQNRAGTDESAKRDESLETIQTELQAARDRLAQAEAKVGLQASELEDLKGIVAEQKQREVETETHAEADQTRTELLSKLEDADRRARQDEDRSAEQIRRLRNLEAQLGAAEKQGQEARDQAVAWAKECHSAQQQVAALKTRIAEVETASSERLTAARREREQLLAELSLHREHTSREADDDACEPPARQGIEMIRTLVTQNPDERKLLRDHMQRFGLLVEWAARWFVRQFSKALLSSDAQIQVDAWATKAVMDLRAASARSPGLFPMGLPEWAEANSMLLGQLALSVAGSASMRIQAAMPGQFRPAPQTTPVPRVVQGRAVPLNPVQLPPVSLRRLPRELEQPPKAAPVSQPVRAPAAALPAPSRAVDAGPKPPATVPPLSWPEQFKQDRLAALKQDLLSISNQLAEEQDIQGRTITARRLRAGVSIGEQALEEAMTERWAYIHNPPPGRTAPVAWVRHGVVLDDESERALRDRATEQLVALETRLRVLKRRRT